MELRTELPHLRNIQPKCWEESDYDKAFSNYIVLVDKSVSKKRHALMLLEDFVPLEVDRKRRGIQSKIDHLTDVLNKRKNLLDTAQQRHAADIIAFLQWVQHNFMLKSETLSLSSPKIALLQKLQHNFRRISRKELDRAEQLTREIKNYAIDQLKRLHMISNLLKHA